MLGGGEQENDVGGKSRLDIGGQGARILFAHVGAIICQLSHPPFQKSRLHLALTSYQLSFLHSLISKLVSPRLLSILNFVKLIMGGNFGILFYWNYQ
jgi:hypothetical protein